MSRRRSLLRFYLVEKLQKRKDLFFSQKKESGKSAAFSKHTNKTHLSKKNFWTLVNIMTEVNSNDIAAIVVDNGSGICKGKWNDNGIKSPINGNRSVCRWSSELPVSFSDSPRLLFPSVFTQPDLLGMMLPDLSFHLWLVVPVTLVSWLEWMTGMPMLVTKLKPSVVS